MEVKKALFISQEINPYLPSSPMSDYCRATAQKIMTSGVEVRTFMPKFCMINERRNQLHEVIRLSGLNIIIDDADHPLVIKVATLQPSRMQVYFIDNEDYFGTCDINSLEIDAVPEDNDERIIFFARGVIETVKKLRWAPDLVQCTGWVSALLPLYARHMYADDPTLRDAKIVYVLHSKFFDGTLDPRFVDKLKQDDFSNEALVPLGTDPVDFKALNRIAIDNADAFIQGDADVDPELIEYARATGKPFLAYDHDADIKTAYLEFYKTL